MGHILELTGLDVDYKSLPTPQRDILISEVRSRVASVLHAFMAPTSPFFRGGPRIILSTAARSFGKPNESYLAYVYSWKGEKFEAAEPIPRVCTQDEASYLAVIAALREVSTSCPNVPVLVRSPSRNVISQATGDFHVRSESMKALKEELESVTFSMRVAYEWVPSAYAFEPLTLIHETFIRKDRIVS
jgi:ribonuclease HI